MNLERAIPDSRKILYLVGILAILFATTTIVYWAYRAHQPKEVKLVQNGETKTIQTKAQTVGELLRERSIALDSYDELSPPPEQNVTQGLKINYTDRWPVTIEVGKEQKTMVTNKKMVGEILQEGQIALGPDDKVSPAVNQPLTPEDKIKITRVEQKVVEDQQTIPFREVKRTDVLLPKGKQQVVQDGKDGKAVLRYQVVYENGEEVSRELVDTEVVQPMQEKIVKIGTLTTVSRGGTDFAARKVLENVKLTAYGPNGEPQSAYTASGRLAAEGRTVASDPAIIPLGTWIYIEGYGFRRTEDTGSAIKGNKLDIYFNSDQEANQFGVRHASKVYVIGPSLPTP